MKSHDCHVLMMQILPVVLRGIMDEHVRETLFGLGNIFDVLSRKSIGMKQLERLQGEIVMILCELKIYFLPAFHDIMVHLLVHVVDDVIHLRPPFLHNMMSFERLNGVLKGYVRNRARLDGSIAKGFLSYECISFCQNYLQNKDDDVPIGLPIRGTSAGSMGLITAMASSPCTSSSKPDNHTLTGHTESRYNTLNWSHLGC
jgi:hypothetical protein